MITTAFVMAILTFGAFIILFYKLPLRVRRFLSKRYILLDIVLCAIVFSALGFALIGVMAAGFISLFISAYLLAYKMTIKEEVTKEKKQTYQCKSHVHYVARCYNWLKREKRNV